MKSIRYALWALTGLLFSTSLFAQDGDLLLFYQSGDDPVTQDFREKYVPQIREMAEAQGIQVKELSVENDAPDLIKFTPAIVFQNHLGRSLYVGRYHYVDKIKTFIRTVKRVPQGDVINKKHDVMVWNQGRTTILTPVKVTPLAGKLPKGFNEEEFHQKALEAIDRGMSKYQLAAHYDARRTDRLMYVALYPYRSEDGKIFISMESYSQFNCVDPVYRAFDNPVSGKWANWEDVFDAAGELLQDEIVRQLGNTERGDGLLLLGNSDAKKTFEDLGFPLPPKPEGSGQDFSAVDLKLSDSWTMAGPITSDVPVVAFSFLPPLDYYAGEITDLSGTLKLGANQALEASTAKFTADMKNLTMGDEHLDHSVGDMIAMVEHPTASFSFESIEVLDQPRITWGALSQFIVNGTMDFKGVQAPLKVSAQMEPVLTEEGEQRLQVFASFTLDLKANYDVDGPDGPPESSEHMGFNLNFLLAPAP